MFAHTWCVEESAALPRCRHLRNELRTLRDQVVCKAEDVHVALLVAFWAVELRLRLRLGLRL